MTSAPEAAVQYLFSELIAHRLKGFCLSPSHVCCLYSIYGLYQSCLNVVLSLKCDPKAKQPILREQL